MTLSTTRVQKEDRQSAFLVYHTDNSEKFLPERDYVMFGSGLCYRKSACLLSVVKVKLKRCIAVSGNHLTATGNHIQYGTTWCYLPPGSGDFPAFTAAEGGTRFNDPGRMQG